MAGDINQEAIHEAIRRANPDKPGDLIRCLRELDKKSAETIEQIVRRLPKKR